MNFVLGAFGLVVGYYMIKFTMFSVGIFMWIFKLL